MNQGSEFAQLLIRSFRSNQMSTFRSRQVSNRDRIAQVTQRKWATVSESLRSLKTNERPWAICSGRSEEMSDRERIAQVAQDKWATVSDSLRSLMINERMSD